MVICSGFRLSAGSTLGVTFALRVKSLVCPNDISQNKYQCAVAQDLNTNRSKTNLTEWGYREGGLFRNTPQKTSEIKRRTLKLRVLISEQSTLDKASSCLLFTVLFTIISLISSTILKLKNGLILFLGKIMSKHTYENYNIARGRIGYRGRNHISDCR